MDKYKVIEYNGILLYTYVVHVVYVGTIECYSEILYSELVTSSSSQITKVNLTCKHTSCLRRTLSFKIPTM